MAQCLIYCRVSTEEQAEKGYSLDTQEKLCRDYADRNGYQVAGVFRDEGKTATKLDRPALQDLLAKCTKGTTVGAVIVQETDRLARNTHDHLTIRAILQKARIKLVSVAQPMLDDSPEGKMIDTILASVNQFQSDLSGRKVSKAMQEKFEQGRWPGWAPLGYLNVVEEGSDDGRRARRTIINDPETWSLIREGFRLYLTGDYSVFHLRDILYERGLRSRRGRKLSNSIMTHMLNNPFYAGLMVWKNARRIGRHEPMITIQEYERVQAILRSHNLNANRRRKHVFLLRGILFCGICGQRFTAEKHPARDKAYYRCAAMKKHSNRNQHVSVESLERQVEEKFKTVQFSPEFIKRVIDRLHEISVRQSQDIQARKQVLFNQQKALEARRDRAEEKLLAGVLTDDAFVRLRTQFNEHLQQIYTQLAALDDKRDCNTDTLRCVLELCRNTYEAYKKAPDALKQHYLGIFWERFVVRDRQIAQAVPTSMILALREETGVLNSVNWCPSPAFIRMMSDAGYLSSLAEKVKAYQAYVAAHETVVV